MFVEPREAVAAVGAGDAFLAGFVAARYLGGPVDECLRYGVACGAESTQRLGAGLVEVREVERLVAEIDVQRLETPAEVLSGSGLDIGPTAGRMPPLPTVLR